MSLGDGFDAFREAREAARLEAIRKGGNEQDVRERVDRVLAPYRALSWTLIVVLVLVALLGVLGECSGPDPGAIPPPP